MVLLPPITPPITPVKIFIVATLLLLLLHVPPLAALLKVAVVPWHIVVVPIMLPGIPLIETLAVTVPEPVL